MERATASLVAEAPSAFEIPPDHFAANASTGPRFGNGVAVISPSWLYPLTVRPKQTASFSKFWLMIVHNAKGKAGPSPCVERHPDAIVAFLDKIEPVLCVLTAIDAIIIPNQRGQSDLLLTKIEAAPDSQTHNPALAARLWPHYPLPFPLLFVMSNLAKPLGPFTRGAKGHDWVVHAHFGSFEHGEIKLSSSPCRQGACAPGTITALPISRPHGLPPVEGERIILSQASSHLLNEYVRLDETLYPPTLGRVRAARKFWDTFDKANTEPVYDWAR